MEFESIEPTGGTFSLAGKLLENPVGLFPSYVADLQFFRVNEVVPGALAPGAFPQQQEQKQRQHPGGVGHKTLIGRSLGKTMAVVL